ncbi:MAG: hypothetical protein AMXMBFR64_48020 [Myxococcales bacterium]
MLDAFGEVELEREVPPRGQTGDLWFVPRVGAPSPVELLGSLARGPTLVELFSGPLKRRAVTGCLSKLFAIQGELNRAVRRATGARRGAEASLVIIATTASQAVLRGFGAAPHSAGVYRLAPSLATMVVAVHSLPREPRTLALRLPGRGRVFREAVADLAALPDSSPLAGPLREALVHWRLELVRRGALTPEEEDFVMQTELPRQWFKRVMAETAAEAEARGEARAALRVLTLRFHEVPASLQARLLAFSDAATTSRLVDLAVQAQTLDDVEAALDAVDAERPS